MRNLLRGLWIMCGCWRGIVSDGVFFSILPKKVTTHGMLECAVFRQVFVSVV